MPEIRIIGTVDEVVKLAEWLKNHNYPYRFVHGRVYNARGGDDRVRLYAEMRDISR